MFAVRRTPAIPAGVWPCYRCAVLEAFAQAAIALVAIANPVGAAPMFVSITQGVPDAERSRLILRATVAVFVILAGAAIFGRPLLELLGVSLAAFRTGGGLVILLMGLEQLRGEKTPVQNMRTHDTDVEDTVMVPFAMPMVAGPGAITTVVTLASRAKAPQDVVVVIGAIAATCLAMLLTLRSAAWLNTRVSARAQRIFLRFMGLILVAMGAQFIAEGWLAISAGQAD